MSQLQHTTVYMHTLFFVHQLSFIRGSLGVPVPPATSADDPTTPAHRVAGYRDYPAKDATRLSSAAMGGTTERAYGAARSPQNCNAILKTLLALPAVLFVKRPRMAVLRKKERSGSNGAVLMGSNRQTERARAGCAGVPSRVLRTRDRCAPLPSLTLVCGTYYML